MLSPGFNSVLNSFKVIFGITEVLNMSLKKRDLKMACRLYWKSSAKIQRPLPSLVILEDTPYTTVDLEVFKKELVSLFAAKRN